MRAERRSPRSAIAAARWTTSASNSPTRRTNSAAARRALADEFDKAEAARKEASDARALGETALAEADKAAREALDAMAARARRAPPPRPRPKPRANGASRSLRAVRSEFECEPAACPRSPGATRTRRCPISTIVRKLESLKKERERLGAVNLRADEELIEVETSRDKLIAERDDLTEAIRKLRRAIGSLNQEGRERLIAAFDVVNGHFKSLFSTLFEGGDAELQLVESDDPLQAGLELLPARPARSRRP